MSDTSPQANPVLRAIAERRGVRKYTPDAVRREETLAILEAGRLAPSGKNRQPCRFPPICADEPEQEEMAKLTKYQAVLRGARMLIAVFLDKEAAFDAVQDCQPAGAAMRNMRLAARSLGPGCAWIGQILSREAAVLNALRLSPERCQLMGVPASAGRTT